jgi:hypothetical protein
MTWLLWIIAIIAFVGGWQTYFLHKEQIRDLEDRVSELEDKAKELGEKEDES